MELHPRRSQLTGRDVLRVEPGGLSFLSLHLADNAKVEEVLLDGRAAEWSFRKGDLRVTLPGHLRRGVVRLEVAYRARFDQEVETRPLSMDNPGFGVAGTIGPEGSFLLAGSGWYPRLEAASASYDVAVTAPEGVVAVTAGAMRSIRAEDGRTVSRWEVKRPVRGLALAAGRYERRETKVGDTVVSTYLTTQNAHLAERYLEASQRHIRFYQKRLGPYPFPKFAVVENFFPTGYGFPSFTLLGGRVLALPFIPETSLKHEIAHCWWGNGVLVDYESGNWSEGLATYLADYLRRELESEEAAREYRLTTLRDYAQLATGGRDFPLSRFGARFSPATRAVGYGKAMFVFHMIRRRVGDEAFWRALRNVASERMFKETSWDDLRAAFVAASDWPARESGAFLRQWVERAGAPKLSLRATRGRDHGGWLVSGELRQEGRPYSLRIPVAATGEGGKASTVVSLDNASAPVRLRTRDRPELAAADPEAHVFRLLAPSEIPSTVNSLKGADEVRPVLGEISGNGGRLAAILLAGLGKRGTRVAQTDEALPDKIAEPLLFIGRPSGAAWTERLREAFPDVDPDTLAGADVPGGADTIFLVGETGDGRLTGWLAAKPGVSAESVEEATRKITHYGKYGRLAFKAGQNLLKRVPEPEVSPMLVRFGEES
ncbi:M1 family metallopeptidase [Desulfohalovibrio reitneri]|uniref:M1 family metallopeptidase n=1 Tax=Desulfohalovibrio reitneri TaxID=1307759 RepID=UPI000AE98188|nr:M1 family aminopeptidase [Desulfohalovibrio reitneri]